MTRVVRLRLLFGGVILSNLALPDPEWFNYLAVLLNVFAWIVWEIREML